MTDKTTTTNSTPRTTIGNKSLILQFECVLAFVDSRLSREFVDVSET